MAAKPHPTTIAGYIDAAPPAGRPHLRRLHALLKSVAPQAQEAIKWNQPFFVEPRFLFAFSAHKGHLSFAPMAQAMEAFSEKLKAHKATKNTVQAPYDEPLPEELIREMAEYCVRQRREHPGDSFW